MNTLYKNIHNVTAYRESRCKAAQWIILHPETLQELLNLVFHTNQDRMAYKAAWVLEIVYIEKPSLLFPYLDYFFNCLKFPKKEQIVRPLANICERICIAYFKKHSPQFKQHITHKHIALLCECCFDWLIEDKKVACSARAMSSLYLIGTQVSWIHPALLEVLEQKINTGTAGYKNRAAKIITTIKNERR